MRKQTMATTEITQEDFYNLFNAILRELPPYSQEVAIVLSFYDKSSAFLRHFSLWKRDGQR